MSLCHCPMAEHRSTFHNAVLYERAFAACAGLPTSRSLSGIGKESVMLKLTQTAGMILRVLGEGMLVKLVSSTANFFRKI